MVFSILTYSSLKAKKKVVPFFTFIIPPLRLEGLIFQELFQPNKGQNQNLQANPPISINIMKVQQHEMSHFPTAIYFSLKKKSPKEHHCTWPSSCVFAAHRGTIFERVAPHKRCRGRESPFRVQGLARIVSRGAPVSHINHPRFDVLTRSKKMNELSPPKKGTNFKARNGLKTFELRTNPIFSGG